MFKLVFSKYNKQRLDTAIFSFWVFDVILSSMQLSEVQWKGGGGVGGGREGLYSPSSPPIPLVRHVCLVLYTVRLQTC